MDNRQKINPRILRAIESYFKNQGISQVMAAKMLDVTPQAVSIQLKFSFGKNVSKKWAKTFGFNQDFLMNGQGELLDSSDLTTNPENDLKTHPHRFQLQTTIIIEGSKINTFQDAFNEIITMLNDYELMNDQEKSSIRMLIDKPNSNE